MKVNIKPVSEIEMRLGLEPNGEGHQFFASECKRFMWQFVPYSGPKERSEGGNLRGSATVDTDTSFIDENCAIHYKTPYAGYQYYGQRADGTHKVVHYTTPGTGPYWDKLMLSVYKETLEQEMQEFIKKRGRK